MTKSCTQSGQSSGGIAVAVVVVVVVAVADGDHSGHGHVYDLPRLSRDYGSLL